MRIFRGRLGSFFLALRVEPRTSIPDEAVGAGFLQKDQAVGGLSDAV